MNDYILKEYTKSQNPEVEMNNLFEEISKIRFAITGTSLDEKDIISYQKKLVEQGLKTKGVKYTDNIQCYFNLNELVVYAVVNGSNTFKVSLCK